MKIVIYPSDKRGLSNLGWLYSRHSFSFGDFVDPLRMGFGLLRVLNDDIVAPGVGFGDHPHSNMEIVSIVLEGAIEHRDSEGNHGVIPAGDVQKMSAGKGITHSEFNPSKEKIVHFLQIWIHPKEKNIKPGYEQKSFSAEQRKNCLLPIVSGTKNTNTLYIHQDAGFFLGSLEENKEASHKLQNRNHGVYVFVIEGEIVVDGKNLSKGDAAAVTEMASLTLGAVKKSEVLLIEVPLK